MKQERKSEARLYTAQIYKYFQARRGKSLALTLDEWSCIQRWREQGLDIESILKGIDLAFSTNNPEDVSSLVHCESAVREAARRAS